MEGLLYITEHLHSSSFFNYLFRVITFLGDGGILWIVLGVLLLCFKKTRRGGLVMLISLAVGFVINDFVLKNLISRPRPFAVSEEIAEFIKSIGMKFPSGYSMPSGHSYASFNCAMVLTLMFGKKGAWSFIAATLIAFSRIFLCVHYPTDVLVGIIFGLLTALATYLVYRAIIKRYNADRRNKIRKTNATNLRS